MAQETLDKILVTIGIIAIFFGLVALLSRDKIQRMAQQESYVEANWNLTPDHVTGEREAVEFITQNGKYMGHVAYGSSLDGIDIYYWRSEPYAVYCDGSGVLLPQSINSYAEIPK